MNAKVHLSIRVLRMPLFAVLLGFGMSAQATLPAGVENELRELLASEKRPARHKARDKYRRPLETLRFCGLDATSTVVEIWPGGQGGWYRRLLEPLLQSQGGTYVPVTADRNYLGKEKVVPYGQVDMVLVFRAHGFMIYDKPAQNYVDSVFRMLRPGGTFCIVDHAGNEAIAQDPEGKNGYVNESHFRAMAERAGFILDASSDHNRNPLDTKDYPRGLYSLPPTLAGTRKGSAQRAVYLEIGESDRFSHRYIKPLTN